MAEFSSATSTSTSGSSGTLTGVVVGSEANRVLYVLLNIGSTSVQASAVTRDGQAATLVNRQAAPAELTQEIWRIIAPNSGTASVSVTLTGSVGELVIGALSFFGVDQTTPNGAVNANPGASEAAHSLSVTAGSASDIVVDLLTVSSSGGTSTPGAGQTERIDDSSIYWRSLAASTKPGILGSVPMAQTLSTTDNGGNVYSAFVVNNASSGDIEAPTITGPITITGRTSTGYTLGGWSATDNVAVTGYERSLDGGATWTDIGLSTSSTVTGRTPGSTDAVRVRAYDAAGNRSTPLTASVTLRYGGVTGATIVSETATGDDGPGALYDSMRPPSTDAKVYEFDVVTPPASGTFTIYNNGSFSLIGAADGAYPLVLRVWEDGVQLSPDLTHTITVGTVTTVSGVTLTATTSLITGTASAASAASGTTLTVSASFLPGSASAVNAGSVAGQTLTVSASFTAGAVTASSLVSGVTLSGGAVSLIAGAASAASSVAGATITATAQLFPGSASAGAAGATVNGQDLTTTVFFLAGLADNASLPRFPVRDRARNIVPRKYK